MSFAATYKQMTSLATAVALTDVPSGCEHVSLQAETQNVRLRGDGTNPTASVGMILYAGDPPYFFHGDVSKIRVIEVTTSAKLNVQYQV